jgi:hypothetical protein
MKPELMMMALIWGATVCVAQDAQAPTPATTGPTGGQRTARPRQTPPPEPAATHDKDSSTEAAEAPKFVSEAKWELAGYNNNEIVYTVFVTNQDTRIIRCTTEVKGFYFENGTRLGISDRQITTVFPNQPTRVGYWMDMDQQSGASYAVKCHPV